MFWLKIIKDFIKILRAGQTPAQIAGGFALGAIVGLSPMFTLQGLVLLNKKRKNRLIRKRKSWKTH
ncbi:MAG: hypothetical protein V1799_18415 [bacterium]